MERSSGVEHQAALSSLIHYGVSQTLIGAFEALAEQTEADGRHRHPEQALRRVRQAVLCRNYAGLCLELAWLLAGIARGAPQRQDAVLRAFYVDGLATRAKFAAALREGRVSLPKGSQWDDATMRLDIDGVRFVLHLDRLPTLVCLLELLVFVEPGILSPPLSLLPPGALANRLQQCLYGFLSEHAQPVHQQRRFHAMLGWLREQVPNVAPAEAICDARIFAFWCDPPAEASDVVRFRTVAEAFLSLREALSIGERAAASGQEIAFEEWAEGLVCLDSVEALAGDGAIALEPLTGIPRFLTRRAAQELELLACYPEAIMRLPLTLARMRVLGAMQALVIDAAKRGHASREVSPDVDYPGWMDDLREQHQALEDMALAAAGLLLAQEDCGDGLAVLLEWMPELVDALAELASEQGKDDLDVDGTTLAAARLRHPVINRAIQRAERALKATTRAGFKGDGDLAPCSEYRTGAGQLHLLARRIERFLAAPVDWAEIFAADRPIASDRLRFLHAGAGAAHE